MSDEQTTTEAPQTDGVGAQDVSASTQPESTEKAEAVTKTEEPAKDSNDDVTKWAESKGIDINNPEDVKKALKSYREAEKKMHESTSQASELKNIVNEEAKAALAATPEDDNTARMQAQLQALQASQAVNDFYQANPDARKYDAEMAKLVQDDPRLAAGGIEALYAVAKVRDLESGGQEQIKKEGGREALQELAQKQTAASPTPSATNMQTSPSGITREDVQAQTKAGNVEWLQKHSKEIDSLYGLQ